MLLALALLLAGAIGTGAHPHVFIDGRVIANFSGHELERITVHWTFDEFFSQGIFQDFGAPQNGTFTPEQVEQIRQGAFQNLANFDYFVFIEVDGRRYDYRDVERFDAQVDGEGRLVYNFDIPLGISFDEGPREVLIEMYDETYFTDIMLEDDHADVQGASEVAYQEERRARTIEVEIWGPMRIEGVALTAEPAR